LLHEFLSSSRSNEKRWLGDQKVSNVLK